MDKSRSKYTDSQDISFHLASSDHDLVEKVSSIMKRNGHLSFSDSMGREHYIVDGRKGAPILARNIDNAARNMSDKSKARFSAVGIYSMNAVDRVLDMSGIPHQLKGFRYLKFILNRLMQDDTLVSPISKTIYPDISRLYECSGLQIERDIRYAVSKSTNTYCNNSPKGFICTMFDIAQRLASEIALEDDKSNESV